jgi:oxygen-independent coproporphyrinogen-3 oxidase
VDTVYFGGGTPSVVPADLVTAVLARIRTSFAVSGDAEITVEVNPESVTPEKLAAYRQAGINRVSIGVQSFSDRNLALLERPHSAADARQAYQSARAAGFDNLSLDLIYGLPGQDRNDWRRDLEAAVALAPEHLSCYTLTFEPRTVFHQRVKKGSLQPLPEGKVSDLFLFTVDLLSARGYAQYEISSFARLDPRNGHLPVSRHNTRYWNFSPYLGFGPAAHSFTENTRSWNVSSVRRYIEEMRTRGSAVADSEELSRPQQMTEALYLGLRTAGGIDIQRFNRRFGTDFNALFGETGDYLTEKGLLDTQPDHCRLTRQGMLLLDAVVEELILNF